MARGGKKWWAYEGSRPIALLLLAAACIGGVSTEGAAVWGWQTFDAEATTAPPIGRYVEVSCDSLRTVGTFENHWQAYSCQLGGRRLPVVVDLSHHELDSRHLRGRLRALGRNDGHRRSDSETIDFRWPPEVVENPATVRAYVEVQTLGPGLARFTGAVLVGLGAIALSFRWGMGPWGRRWRKRRLQRPR